MTDNPSGSADVSRSDASSSESVPLNDVLSALADGRRRYVLHCLRTYQDPMALADLADELAVHESDAAITDVPAEEVKWVYVSLYHVHVPKLAEAGLVEYCQERDTVALSANADDVAPVLDAVPE